MGWKTKITTVLLVIPVSLRSATQLSVAVDKDARNQAEAAVRDAQLEGNPAAIVRACRRWLEFYPNEPVVQAGIYRAMALASEQNGDADQAKVWNNVAVSLDPAGDIRAQAAGAATRGGLDKLTAALTAINQAAQTIQTVRQTFNAANPRAAVPAQGPTAFAPQPVGTPGFQPQPVTQPQPGYAPQPQYMAQPGQQAPQTPQFIPQAGQPQPIALDAQGNPISQPAQIQPIALDAQGNPIAQAQVQPQYQPQQPQPMQPQMQPQQQMQAQMQQPQPTQAQPMQPQYQPQQQAQVQVQQQMQPMQAQPMQPQYQPQQQAQVQQQMQPMQAQPQQPQYQSQQSQQMQGLQGSPQRATPAQYVQQRAPYGVPAGYARPQQARRGDVARAIRVFHDHSQLGDRNYFEPPCGALLLAENGVLTFTPSGGEAPLMIPASEILEIRINATVGGDAGAFHIVTRKGLYLQLAPEGATADEGRADVDELHKELGLDN